MDALEVGAALTALILLLKKKKPSPAMAVDLPVVNPNTTTPLEVRPFPPMAVDWIGPPSPRVSVPIMVGAEFIKRRLESNFQCQVPKELLRKA